MRLKNNFDPETRELFRYYYNCFNCGRSDRGLELHHILGRISNSPFNAFLICLECHAKANHSQEEERRYFALQFKFLNSIVKYKPVDNDYKFLEENGERLNLTELVHSL